MIQQKILDAMQQVMSEEEMLCYIFKHGDKRVVSEMIRDEEILNKYVGAILYATDLMDMVKYSTDSKFLHMVASSILMDGLDNEYALKQKTLDYVIKNPAVEMATIIMIAKENDAWDEYAFRYSNELSHYFLVRLAKEDTEGICSFALSFCKETDDVVVRIVLDTVSDEERLYEFLVEVITEGKIHNRELWEKVTRIPQVAEKFDWHEDGWNMVQYSPAELLEETVKWLSEGIEKFITDQAERQEILEDIENKYKERREKISST